MTLKNRVLLLLIVSGVLTAGVLVMLAVAYLNYFPTWATLCLLLTVFLAISSWAVYYVTSQKYKEEINPDKKKHYGTGNRKNRRKGK